MAFFIISAASTSGAATQQQLEKAEGLRKSAVEFFKTGNYAKAVPLFKEILTILPQDADASQYLLFSQQLMVEPFCKQAAEAYQAADYKKSIEIWGKITKLYPDDKRVPQLIAFGNVRYQAHLIEELFRHAEKDLSDKKIESAISELEQLLSMKPNDGRASELLETARKAQRDEKIREHFELADAYAREKKFDFAVEEWKKILELDATQEKASRLIAETARAKLETLYVNAKQLCDEGDYVAARQAYNGILEQNPTDIDVQTMIDRLDRTIKVVQTVKEKGPVWDMVRKALALHIAVGGNVKASVVAIRYAELLESDNKRIAPIRDFIEQEHLDVVRSMPPVSRDTDIIEQILASSLNHIYDGRFDLAVEECVLVLELQPQNVLALKRLGSAYFAMGKRGKAMEVWGKALRLSPNDRELRDFIGKGK